MPRMVSTRNTASTTPNILLPNSPRSSSKPNTLAIAWMASYTAGMKASQNCLFAKRTFQLIIILTSYWQCQEFLVDVVHHTVCAERVILHPAVFKVISLAHHRVSLRIATVVFMTQLCSQQSLYTAGNSFCFLRVISNALDEIPDKSCDTGRDALYAQPLINRHLLLSPLTPAEIHTPATVL